MRRCLFAYTEATPPSGYPRYVNVSADEDRFEVTVRGPAQLTQEGFMSPGYTAMMPLSRVEFYRLCADSIAYLYDLPGAPVPQGPEAAQQEPPHNELEPNVRTHSADSD